MTATVPAMDFKPFAACRTSEGWWPIEIPSDSEPGIRYVVMVCPWGNATENICECRGYFHRSACKHQRMAMDALCGWTELQVGMDGNPRYVQTPEERNAKVCPRCQGPTTWKMEIVENDSPG